MAPKDPHDFVDPTSSWKEWANYVLLTLEDLKHDSDENKKLISKMVTELNVLKTKVSIRAGLIGAIAGFLPALAILIYFLLKNHHP